MWFDMSIKLTVSLSLIIFMVGCSDEIPPDLKPPDFLSPEGKEVINESYKDLKACQDIQSLAVFSEIISLSDPVGYSAGLVGQSVGTGNPSLPTTDNIALTTSIDKICCESISKRINGFVVQRFNSFNKQQTIFWKRLTSNLGSEGRCIPPKPLIGGRMSS